MKLRYRIGTRLIWWTWRTLFGFKVFGRENIPKKGGVIIAANHLSNYDPPLIGTAIYSRECFYFAKGGLFIVSKWFTWLLKIFNGYPGVDTNGRLSKSAIKKTLEIVKKGQVVLLFPEGTRSKKGIFLQPQKGIGYLALKTLVPIVPAFISGTNISLWRLFLRKGEIYVKFGEPFTREYFLQFKNDNNAREKISEDIMDRIKELKFIKKPLAN